MKVLIVSTFMPPYTGGAEQVAWETARRLAKYKGLEIHMLTTGREGSEVRENVVIHTVPYKKPLTLCYSTLYRKKIDKILEQNNFDLIHFHMPLPWGFILRNSRIKKIITSHGNIDKIGIKLAMWYNLRRIALSHADSVTVPSRWMKETFKVRYGLNCALIPNGVDTKQFKPLRTKGKGKTVLFVGRFIDIKGVNELINVARELPEYEFWFVGHGPLSRIINLPNTKNLGFKNKEELVKLYNKATICVFPFYKECFPLVGLEAMASGKAVVTTEKGFSEFIGQGKEGLMIEPKSEKQLKDAIVKLMEDSKLRKRLERNARKKALKYDWDGVVGEYYRVYKNISRGAR